MFDLLERPKLLKIKPDEGACIKETEVWIWGAKFAAKANMRVLFGNVCATITATEGASILCCTAPARYVNKQKASLPYRFDLVQDTKVRVMVANVHPQHGVMWAQEHVTFTYRALPQMTKPLCSD